MGALCKILGGCPLDSRFVGAGLILQRIESSLHETVWRMADPQSPRAQAFVALEDGGGHVEGRAAHWEGTASPALLWLAQPGTLRFRADAGTAGYIGWVSEEFLARTTADYSEASILGLVAGHDRQLRLAPGPAQEVFDTLGALHHEFDTPRAGSGIVVAALFRILLVTMLRLAGAETPLEGGGSNTRFLQRFRELVEANFRAHWPIARYAETIGVSHDRLHSLCTRQLGKTPKALVAERLAREAGLGLERSTLSIEQLSYALGFRDPAHFSHFFKRVTGVSPGTFRRRVTGAARDGQIASTTTFADWP
jgi:AraC family transcriptional regulator, transcriptional activator of pobA